MEVVGQASDGHSTVDLARELLPDIVVMDISMPDLNGIEATREIQREAPGVRVIALSMHSAKRYVTEMFRAGASGYLLKDCDFDELARAMRTVADGKTYVSPSISNVVVEDLVHTEEKIEDYRLFPAHATGARGPATARRRQNHQADRPAAAHQSQDRRSPSAARDEQAGDRQCRAAHQVRHPGRSDLVGAVRNGSSGGCGSRRS